MTAPDLLVVLAWCAVLTAVVAVGIWLLWAAVVLPVAKIWELITRA